MRRTPIVITATVAGLIGVLEFYTRPALAGIATIPAASPDGGRELTTAQAPAEVSEVLERCAVARDLSAGWFDPWAMPGGVDPSGYVKGWAAQLALAAFSALGIPGALVDAAGDIATSETYERGAHLIDPHSGLPAARASSASVTGPDLGLADALATVLAVAGEPARGLIDAIEGYEALIINHDGSRRRTNRFPIAAAGAALLPAERLEEASHPFGPVMA